MSREPPPSVSARADFFRKKEVASKDSGLSPAGSRSMKGGTGRLKRSGFKGGGEGLNAPIIFGRSLNVLGSGCRQAFRGNFFHLS